MKTSDQGLLKQAHDVAQTKALFDSVKPNQMIAEGAPSIDALRVSALGKDAAIPEPLRQYLAAIPAEFHGHALDSVSKGAAAFEAAHGFPPRAEMFAAALQASANMAAEYEKACRKANRTVDYAFDEVGTGMSQSMASNSYALHPNAVISTAFQMLSEEIWFAGRLPVDYVSSEGRMAVLNNIAGSTFGEYDSGASLDGVNGGKPYISAQRVVVLSTNGGGNSPIFSGVVKTRTGGATLLPFLRGRSRVLVSGRPVALETSSNGSGASTIAGSVTISGTTYALAGTVTPDTGAYSITATPALPANTHVALMVIANYEANPTLAPVIKGSIDTYKFHATASRARSDATLDSYAQAQSELGLDIVSAAMMAMRSQYNMERLYSALSLMRLVGMGLTTSWNFDWATQGDQKTRADVMIDFMPVINTLSQRMVIANRDHGIDSFCVTGLFAQVFDALPSTLWQPSGLAKRPGVYRLGRYGGLFDVYYVPDSVGLLSNDDAAGTTEVLCLGRGSTNSRCPLIVGDVIAPMLTPLADTAGAQVHNFFYTKNFTESNPSDYFAQGAALITITGLV